MRGETRKRRVWLGLVLCLSMNLLTGCKEKTIDYDVDGVTESSTENGSKSAAHDNRKKGLAQFAGAKDWYDAWTAADAKGNWVDFLVDAKINVPDVEQMSVVEVKEPEFDSAYKKQMAERLFGDGEIYYYDMVHLPKAEVEKRLEDYWKPSRVITAGEYDAQTVKIEMGARTQEEINQELSYYRETLEAAGDSYVPVNEYDVDEYLGTYEGKSFELTFMESGSAKSNDAEVICRSKEILFQAKDLSQFCPKEIRESGDFNLMYTAMDENFGILENQCALSEEDAKKLADRFVDEMGMDYSVDAGSIQLGWWKGASAGMGQNEGIDFIADGYVFLYDAGVDSISFTKCGTQELERNFSENKSGEPQYLMKARMEVYVNENGVIGMKAQNPIEITGILDKTELLPLEAIQGIVKEQLAGDVSMFRFESKKAITFNEAALVYFRVRDKENAGYYSYVPTWRLAFVKYHDADGYATWINEQILINAIDGSVIDFYDEA